MSTKRQKTVEYEEEIKQKPIIHANNTEILVSNPISGSDIKPCNNITVTIEKQDLKEEL